MKNRPSSKRAATPREIVRLARKVKWQDVKSPNGEVVEGKTIQEMFKYASAAIKREQRRKRVHAALT